MASVQRRPDGRWRARWHDETGRERAKHFDRKGEATRFLADLDAARRNGTYVDPSIAKTTLAAFYADWAPRQVWAATTVTAMDVAVRGCTFKDVEFGRLRRSHVEAWVKTMSLTLAPSTIRTRVNNVRAALRAAVRDKLLASDPSDGVTLPRARKAEHAMRIPTPETVGSVLRAADDWFRPFVALCAFAGLRLGEAAAVQFSDIDFLRRQLHVQRQVQRATGGEVRITPPKYGSERIVHLPDELMTMLAQHASLVGTHGDEQWMFLGDNGNPPHQNTIHYWWTKTLRAADAEPTRLHDLRHFYASGLIAAGCDVATVQRALGHAKATTTLQTYTHLWPTAEDRTRSAAAGIMRAVSAAPADSARTENAQTA
ncbi:site-specific integrase [Curtobacterium sp. MCSS17_007]|uniref:tyrosine-type recombinase/integrase n=1 Tax=Curtobacterium sp. MCSS17_007 TaxID=2175646 RepID=UPI0015E896A1|nr:site-specific integrase [Curtobacterium sp. MCSS17_007]WIE76393.1 tyrosine-type recombinase/integrase [Curtobacterium sp. MCSS17_007]